jgi:hypothetical protein
MDPRVLDKVDGDQFIDEAANILSVPSRVVISDDKVAAVRAERKQQQQQQAQVEQAKMGAEAAKSLSETTMNQDSMLDQLMATGGSRG